MKRLKILLMLAVCTFVLMACQKDDSATGSETDAMDVDEVEKEDNSNDEGANSDVGDSSEAVEDAESDDVETDDAESNLENRSFRMDQDKEYIAKQTTDGEETEITQTYVKTFENEKGVWDQWQGSYDSNEYDFLHMENEEGFYSGVPESEYYQLISYPIEKGAIFEDWGGNATTTKIDETITVEAGTFDHVVVVESEDGVTNYFDPMLVQF